MFSFPEMRRISTNGGLSGCTIGVHRRCPTYSITCSALVPPASPAGSVPSSAPNMAAGLTSPNHTGSPCGNSAQTKNERSRSVLSRSPPICAARRWRSTTESAAPSSDCRLCRPSWLETRSCHWCRLQSSRLVDHPSDGGQRKADLIGSLDGAVRSSEQALLTSVAARPCICALPQEHFATVGAQKAKRHAGPAFQLKPTHFTSLPSHCATERTRASCCLT